MEKGKFDWNEYSYNYTKNNYDRISLITKKGMKEKLMKLYKEKGYSSLSVFINEAIDEKLKSMGIEL